MPETKPVISRHALERIVRYLTYLKELPSAGPENISAAAIAEALGLHQVQVRKDLAALGEGGKPRIGYARTKLVREIEHFLNYDNLSDAVVAGVGNLGKALLSYEGFTAYGLKIIAGFDVDRRLIGTEIRGKMILDTAQLSGLCRRLNVRIGILAVPAAKAQEVCEQMVSGGIRAVWNFTPANLAVPERVVVKNESLAASFVLLAQMLARSFAGYGMDQ
jgi:redox-sensing transcriptional repressor